MCFKLPFQTKLEDILRFVWQLSWINLISIRVHNTSVSDSIQCIFLNGFKKNYLYMGIVNYCVDMSCNFLKAFRNCKHLLSDTLVVL